jgi:hypothetical protein
MWRGANWPTDGLGMGRSLSRPRRVARVVAFVALLLVVPVAMAAPASAHTRAQASSNYESRIVAAPALAGVAWRLYTGGEYLEVTNHGPQELLVLGYEGEPYLRIGPEGVFENRNSPATYLNAERYADVALPPRADATTEPVWTRVADGATWAWHDHRVHWMSSVPPAIVAESGGEDVHLMDWSVAFEHGGETYELRGQLHWVERGSWWPWLGAALLLTSPIAAGLPKHHLGSSSWLRPAAAGVGAVALFNSIHFVDELLAWPSPTLDVMFGLLHTALFVGLGVVGAGIAWRGGGEASTVLGVASGAVVFHQGVLQLPILIASQLPTIWPGGLLRLAVAVSLGQAFWVAVVIVVTRLRRRAQGASAPATTVPTSVRTGPPADTHRPR